MVDLADLERRTLVGAFVRIDYTNYRGERKVYNVLPVNIWFGSNQFHGDKPQWFMTAWKAEPHVQRDFAIKDIHSWEEIHG